MIVGRCCRSTAALAAKPAHQIATAAAAIAVSNSCRPLVGAPRPSSFALILSPRPQRAAAPMSSTPSPPEGKEEAATAEEKSTEAAPSSDSPPPPAAPLPPPPEMPMAGDCCGSGCVRCVWDMYYEELEAYNKLIAERGIEATKNKATAAED